MLIVGIGWLLVDRTEEDGDCTSIGGRARVVRDEYLVEVVV